ncbi:MAG: alpha-hydroxy-acid oxidizing protein, partial [Bacteroidetes bacterium]
MPDEKRLKQLMNKYPAIEDLRRRARRRIPFVAWEYMETGTGAEGALRRNRQRLDAITFVPRFMKGELSPDLRTQLLGRTYSAPFGVAPVGLMGLMWPRAEQILARTASRYGIPFCLSTVATQTPEAVGPLVGEMGWFQLYPPREPALRAGLLQ